MDVYYKLGFTLFSALFGIGMFMKGSKHIWREMRAAKSEKIEPNWGARFLIFFETVILQKKLFKELIPGIAHATFYYGFLVITYGTAESVLAALIPGASLHFLGPIHSLMVLSEDIMQPLVCLAIVYGVVRRTITKPKRLRLPAASARDGLIILGLIALHMGANMLSHSGYLLAKYPVAEPELRFFTMWLASIYFDLGMQESTGLWLGHFGWTMHMISVFGLLAYLPHSKHLHIITSQANAFLARLRHKGTLSKVNFEDQENPVFGVSKATQFSWKDILDVYSCTECGRCNDFCPTATTNKPLRPRELIMDLKRHLKENPQITEGQDPAEALISETYISEQTIWACTTCRACVEACPVLIEHVDKIVDLRRNLVLMEGRMPEELQNTMRNWETQSNPWGISSDVRDEWANGLEVPRMADHPQAQYLFYVGCAGSFNDRNKKIATAMVKILKAAKIDFAILGKEELCNGETARRAGNEYLSQTMFQMNIEVLNRYQVKQIITICPHCFNTLKNEYPDFGFRAERVWHHTEFIDKLIQDKTLSLDTSSELKIAFHDSCYLGRYNEVYDAPRSALAATGATVLEAPRSRSKGLCCGAGGARMWMEETIGERINFERSNELLATQPQVIAAGCPFCQVMITDGVKRDPAAADKVRVLDVAEIVADRVKV